MGRHALLSASASKRWLSCTPSARLEEQFKDEAGGSVYAEEGTAAHALAEHKLKKALKRRSKRPVSDYQCDEMEECTDGYVAFAMEQVELARQECADPVVLIEQRLDYSAYVPEGFGTGDLLIVADKVLTVIDLKYGKGVAVDAEWNPQMMLYGLGALELFDALYDIDIIRMVIYQPRLESVSTWEISVKDLMEWVEMELKPKAVLAIKGEGEYRSGDWLLFGKLSAPTFFTLNAPVFRMVWINIQNPFIRLCSLFKVSLQQYCINNSSQFPFSGTHGICLAWEKEKSSELSVQFKILTNRRLIRIAHLPGAIQENRAFPVLWNPLFSSADTELSVAC